mgnify:CR=1 FL=1
MASLSEILNSKAEMKQQRTESRRAEREQLSQMRDGALMAITTNPDLTPVSSFCRRTTSA